MEDIPEITPSRDSDLEHFVEGVFERSPKALEEKNKYVQFMKDSTFYPEKLEKSIAYWNDAVINSKGFEGQHSTLDTFKNENGELELIYYKGSDTIRFFYKRS